MSGAQAAWSRPALLEQVLRTRRDGRAEVALRMPALAQARRAIQVERLLQATPGVASFAFEVAAQRARVVFDPARLPLPGLLDACARAACEATPLHRACLDDVRRDALNASLKRLLVAGIFAMQAMMFALVLYLGAINPLDATTARLFRWLGLLSAIPVVGYAAWPYYRDALAGLRAGRAGIDLPVAIAVVLIFGASVGNAARGSGEVYFDSISMFVFVLLLGRHLELRAQARHRALAELAADMVPLLAQRRGANGVLETVAATELAIGDCVHVAEGSAIPCDGVLDSVQARLDESQWTGESAPRTRRRGDAVAAGAIAMGGPLDLRVARTSATSALAVLERLADAARRRRGFGAVGGDRAARRFVWRVLLLALATTAFWLWRDPARAFDATLAVLVVACPCAFGLAAPAVVTRSLAILARHGVLVVREAALPALARVDFALFDKTGTLTEPVTDRDDAQPLRERLRADAACCVRGLRDNGIECAIASGDVADRVDAAAAWLDIGAAWSRQSPADKLARVREAQAQGRVVLAVGDGGNDVAALAAADVSAAPGDAVDLARARADLLLVGGMSGLPLACTLARRTVVVLAQNRRWSLAWNLAAVPFAAAGWVSPWLAALGMSLSSLAVVLNSLRIRAVVAPPAPQAPVCGVAA